MSNSYQSVFAPGLFAEQTIILTGGGSGFGRCMAHELTYLGARVVILGRTLEKLQTVAGEIEEDGGLGVGPRGVPNPERAGDVSRITLSDDKRPDHAESFRN